MDVETFLKKTRGSVANLIIKRIPGFGFSEDSHDHMDSI